MPHHIQDVLKSVQEGAPAPRTTTDDIIAKAGRIRARRAATAVAGGVVACIALTATAVNGLGASNGDGQYAGAPPAVSAAAPVPSASAEAPVSSAPPVQPADFSSKLAEYRVGAYQIGPVGQVAPGYQEIPVYQDGQTWPDEDGTDYPLAVATITAYAPGVYDPATFGGVGDSTLIIGAQYRARVGGKSAIGRDLTFISPVDPGRNWVRAALAWQYAPDAWATLMPNYATTDLPRADAVKIAAGLTTGRKKEVRVPYHLGSLPGGWRPVAVTQTSGKVSSLVSKLFLHDGPLTESAAAKIDEAFPHNAMVTVSKGARKDDDIHVKHGLHCYPGRSSCVVIQGDYLIEVTSWSSALSDAEVKQIAQGLRIGDVADQKTWVPVGE